MNKYLFLCVLMLVVIGCSTPTKGPTSIANVGVNVRSDLKIIVPTNEEYITWEAMLKKIDSADVILLGELHDHAVGHAVQFGIVEDVMKKYPGSVLALEMLERDEQLRVDDYMDDLIDADKLALMTQSDNWGGKGGWAAWYQPIIDVVKNSNGEVVAANAPRRYVRLARLEGYERIDALPLNRRVFIDYPENLSGGKYRQRFWEFASHGDEGEEAVKVDVTTIDPDDPMLPTFKSMQAWDATMAQSVVNANPSNKHKVVLLVGQFHVEYDGGIVQEIRNRMPSAKVLVVSIQREIPDEDWRGDDSKENAPPIADIMIVENATN
ncbi:MAG TPA: hypothetical protein EYO01_05315 [Phycisphaerales bacterium]|nr:hypothetical protein [Phycisphaerales bacterium]HIB50222.1 hypothetical protein [Phycisphaerales bacterium]HIN83645.1 hypothetical protein [Phycisphaerales bacterium]HIO20281.1 hypothetical protein [Phycisphaerales bacterium]HIO52716.1 hypothetical protein [Phycisphaerales bacterium]